jgi:hypothetical protein
VRASTGAVPFTTRDTVAVETPALFATSLMFMRCASRRVNERVGLNPPAAVNIEAVA